jgi:hypothetical protein
MSAADAVEFADTAKVRRPCGPRVITFRRFCMIEAALRRLGFGEEIDNAQQRGAPTCADAFAREVVFVIVNSGMRWSVAGPIYAACAEALDRGASATTVFGHPGKAKAIDSVWHDRERLFAEFADSDDLLGFCGAFPFVGAVTKYHLAKNLGGNFVKPDVHLTRLAAAARTSPWRLCHRLAQATGHREAAVDTILWRACAERLIDSRVIAEQGWNGATRPPKAHFPHAVDR